MKLPPNPSLERTRTSRSVSSEIVSLWRLVRAAHAGRSMDTNRERSHAFGPVAAVCIALLSASACGRPKISVGSPLVYSDLGDKVALAASGVCQTNIDNQNGVPIPGIVVRDASLIRNGADLSNATRHVFVIFDDFLLGNMARGSYWRSQAARRLGLDIPVVNTSETRVYVVTTDTANRIERVEHLAAAHAQLSVDTNDFGRAFVP
jgi:hypothetical protein